MTNRETIARELLIARFHNANVADEIMSSLDLTENMRHEMIVAFRQSDRLIASRHVGVNAELIEALSDFVALGETQMEQAAHCGDPDYECPMQDMGRDDDLAGHIKRARAALAKAKGE